MFRTTCFFWLFLFSPHSEAMKAKGHQGLLAIVAAAACIYASSLSDTGTAVALSSRLSRVRSTMNRLSARLDAGSGRPSLQQPAMARMSSIISRDASRFAMEVERKFLRFRRWLLSLGEL